MTTIYYWRVKCTTDNTFEYIWSPTEPTTCPINASHTIDPTKTTVVDKIEPGVTKIKEESLPTGGNFKVETRVLNAAANTTEILDYSWPFPISVYSASFVTTADHEGDDFSVMVAPNTLIGSITNIVNASDTVINVSSTVTDNVELGYKITINDGTNSEDLGYIVAKDATAGTITVQNATVNGYSPFTPTLIYMNVPMVENYEFGPAWEYTLAKRKIGGTYVPANTVFRASYVNKSLSVAKKLVISVEFTY